MCNMYNQTNKKCSLGSLSLAIAILERKRHSRGHSNRSKLTKILVKRKNNTVIAKYFVHTNPLFIIIEQKCIE